MYIGNVDNCLLRKIVHVRKASPAVQTTTKHHLAHDVVYNLRKHKTYWKCRPVSYTHLDVYKRQVLARSVI